MINPKELISQLQENDCHFRLGDIPLSGDEIINWLENIREKANLDIQIFLFYGNEQYPSGFVRFVCGELKGYMFGSVV